MRARMMNLILFVSEKGPDSESGDLACAISKTFINQGARSKTGATDR